MAKPTKGNQKGAQTHAEGQQGSKTRQAFQEQINEHGGQEDETGQRAANDPGRTAHGEAELHEHLLEHGSDGAHRLVEGRKQHDEAERMSERNRQTIDRQRHDHDEPLPPPRSSGK